DATCLSAADWDCPREPREGLRKLAGGATRGVPPTNQLSAPAGAALTVVAFRIIDGKEKDNGYNHDPCLILSCLIEHGAFLLTVCAAPLGRMVIIRGPNRWLHHRLISSAPPGAKQAPIDYLLIVSPRRLNNGPTSGSPPVKLRNKVIASSLPPRERRVSRK